MTEKKEKSLFHIVPITRGEYGYLSKVQEELEEALDAEKQENPLLLLIELSDIIGAVGGVADRIGSSLEDLVKFSNLVRHVRKTRAAEAAEAEKTAKMERREALLDKGDDRTVEEHEELDSLDQWLALEYAKTHPLNPQYQEAMDYIKHIADTLKARNS